MTTKDLVSLIENPVLLNEEKLPGLSHLLEEYPYFQTARMLYVKTLSNVKDSTLGSELRKMAFYTGDRKQMFYQLSGEHFASLREILEKEEELSIGESFELIESFLKNTGEDYPEDYFPEVSHYSVRTLLTTKENTQEEKLESRDIIDDFLEKEMAGTTGISLKDTAGDFAGDKEAAPDSPEDTQFFSETLAKIYIKQQKYDKALEIIQKLHLLYPEKSVYFADQIRFLEKLIINAKK